MPVHHRLRFLTFPMRTSRLCSLWPDMRPLRFRRVPVGRDVAFDPGGATASRITMPHILPSTVPSVSASATFFLSWLTPHPIRKGVAYRPAACQVARPPLTDRTRSPRPQRAFTSRLPAVWSPSLPLDITTTWTGLLLLAGLAPARMAASLAAPDPTVRLSRSGLSSKVKRDRG